MGILWGILEYASKIRNKSTGGSLQESGPPFPCQLSHAAGGCHRLGRRRGGRVGTAGSGEGILAASARPAATRPSPLLAKDLTGRHTVPDGAPCRHPPIPGKIRAGRPRFTRISKRI